jgi:hypothetical protein
MRTPLRPGRRFTSASIVVLALLGLTSLFAADGPTATEAAPLFSDALRPTDIDPTEPVVKLSELQVGGRVKLKHLEDDWLYTHVGTLEILSNADPSLTRESIQKLQQLEQAMALFFPQLRSRPRLPLTLVFCGNRSRFESFRHRGKTPAEGQVASLFVHDADRAVIVVDLEFYPLNRQRRLYRIYSHYILSQLGRPIPASLAEGLARVFSLSEIDGDQLTLPMLRPGGLRLDYSIDVPGALLPPSFSTDDGRIHITATRDELWASLGEKPLIPLSQLFSTGYDSPDFLNPINNPFAIQSMAFVHMCLFGRTQEFKAGFLNFLERSAREPVTETLFQECFGISHATMEGRLARYINAFTFSAAVSPDEYLPDDMPAMLQNGIAAAIREKKRLPTPEKGGPDILPAKYVLSSAKIPRAATTPSLELTKASYASIARIKADALMMAGHHDEAREELLSAVMRKHADARVFASFGFLARATNEPGVSLHYLRKAALAAVDLPGPYLYLAQEKLAAARSASPTGVSSNEADAAATLRLLYAARRFSPRPRLELYEALAETWTSFTLAPTQADLDVLAENLAYLGNTQLTATVARLAEKHSRPANP